MFFVDYFHGCIKYLTLRHTKKQAKSATPRCTFGSRLSLDNHFKSQILTSNSIIDSRHKFLSIVSNLL